MASTSTTKARAPKTIQGKVRTMADPAQQKSMQEYEAALKAMQDGKFDKASDAFRKLIPQAPPEIAERARVYLDACNRQAAKQDRKFAGPEEQYDYAISLLNTGLYDEAREQLEAILAKEPQARYAQAGSHATLTALVFASILLGHPFTESYARETTPREFWNTAEFHQTNRVISAVWGLAFLVSVPLGRPLAGALACAWYPFPPAFREGTTFRRVFGIESLVWAGYFLGRSALRLALLLHGSL